jgi:hypothetical protein
LRYDYGKGATHLAIVADTAEEIVAQLQHVKIVDPDDEGLDSGLVERLRAKARKIEDSFWDEMRESDPSNP